GRYNSAMGVSQEPGEWPTPPGAVELLQVVQDREVCPYLKDRAARTEVRFMASLGGPAWDDFLAAGFRRFGWAFFRPVCRSCSQCTPLRVPVDRFRPSRSQRRVLRRNRDVEVEIGEPLLDEERLALHHAFHAERSARVGWEAESIGPEE